MNVNSDSISFFTALASAPRLKIIELLGEREMNIGELSAALGISSTIVVKHIRSLESANIVRTRTIPGKRGTQKLCRLYQESMLLRFSHEKAFPDVISFELPIGSYVGWSVKPTCGMMDAKGNIGFTDDPRVFADPRRIGAGLIYIGHGWLEYVIPNYVSLEKQIVELRFQLEICSEAPGYAMDWPSDICFDLNGVRVGQWTCPGDYGDKRGIYSPAWYKSGANSQYGEFKQIVVNSMGSYIDGSLVSTVRIGEIPRNGDFRFRIVSPEDTPHPGGFNLFGKGFGNYDQHIMCTIVAA